MQMTSKYETSRSLSIADFLQHISVYLRNDASTHIVWQSFQEKKFDHLGHQGCI